MADPVLHIKDAYFFELPKLLAPAAYESRADFPEVWVKLDPEFQDWEFDHLYTELTALQVQMPPKDEAHHEWRHWQHADHANFAKPFDEFLELHYQQRVAEFQAWKKTQVAAAEAAKDESEAKIAAQRPIEDYLKTLEADDPYGSFITLRSTPAFQAQWRAAKQKTGSYDAVREYQGDSSLPEWSKDKIDAYNFHLSGKVLIPQPFGELRNLHERESGVGISKFLLIEIFVGLVIVLIFHQLAKRVADGQPPKGKLWNLLEAFLVFVRDQIARPVLGSHGHHEDGHGDAHNDGDHHDDQHQAAKAHTAEGHHPHVDPARKFEPLLWTLFFFVLGCNLMGMVPWAGSPTAAFAVTFALACITFGTGLFFGMRQFGVGGFFLNQIPGMDLPWYMAIFIKPMILVIELLGLCIKHGVLSVRLLANMVAGHLVILGVMGLAFGAEAALRFTAPGVAGWQWGLTAAIAVIGAAAFNVLELFVAFLQAYIFTFLSALFIGAAIHKH
ncbi:MAG TPA: F0F1 ATP synthase subunit A [Aestuariivirgaceae bacterium]|nr:F0F1 ATP synthase subunit A [Aestuariivirgaceae bacterium]